MVKCVVKLKNCRIGTKIGVVVDMDPSDKKAKRQKGKQTKRQKDKKPKNKIKSKNKKLNKNCIIAKTHAPPTAFSVPKRNKKEKKEEKQEKSQSEDPHYRKGHV